VWESRSGQFSANLSSSSSQLLHLSLSVLNRAGEIYLYLFLVIYRCLVMTDLPLLQVRALGTKRGMHVSNRLVTWQILGSDLIASHLR